MSNSLLKPSVDTVSDQGWHPTLHDFSYSICIISSILAIGYSFSKIRSLRFWFEASPEEKRNRVITVNLWLVVCWVMFTLRREFQGILDTAGFRGIYANSILMGLTYVVPLGVLPVFYFGRDVKLNDDSEGKENAPIRPHIPLDPNEKSLLDDIDNPRL